MFEQLFLGENIPNEEEMKKTFEGYQCLTHGLKFIDL